MEREIEHSNDKIKFQLNKANVSQIGFDLSSDKKLYEVLISPFEDDQEKAHPLCAHFPQGFKTDEFQFDKVNQRLNQQSLLYIFYNVIQERMQLHAARSLTEKGFKYHKNHKVWVRKFQKQFKFFSIAQWKYEQFRDQIKQEEFYTREDFSQK